MSLKDKGKIDEEPLSKIFDVTRFPRRRPISSEVDSVSQNGRKPRRNQTEIICEWILEREFDTKLDEQIDPNLIWRHVNTFLEEMSCIIDSGIEPQGSTSISNQKAPQHQLSPQSRSEAREPRGSLSGGGDDSKPRADEAKPGADNSAGKNQRSKKKQQNFNDDDDDDQSLQDEPARAKRRSLDAESLGFACPYRKRNPERFNIRDYLTCATSVFENMFALK
jgi:hypothetical protein